MNDNERIILIISTADTLATLAWNEFITFKEMNKEMNVKSNVIMNFLGPIKNIPIIGHAIIAIDIRIIIDTLPSFLLLDYIYFIFFYLYYQKNHFILNGIIFS